MDRLEQIKQEMEELVGMRDTEVAHGRADKLLCDLAELLASRIGGKIEQEVSATLKAYSEIDKQYA